jgi:hypothetical protein
MNHVGEMHSYRTSEYNGWYPCISVDGLFFIWTSMINMQVQKEGKESSRMKLIMKKSQASV